MAENSDHNPDPSDETVPGPSLSPATPHTIPEPSRTQWHSGQPYHHELPGSGNHWKECKNRVDKFDRDFCAGWNSEIDSLLTFAGLFSAVVTAFTVESYQWLQPNPQDTSNQILLNISAQLAGQNITTSTLPPFSPSPSSIRINIFWFLSLIFSLTAGLLGILCKQWLRHYQDDTLPLPKLQSFILRQFRYEGLTQWGVKNILDTLPPLLEIGLVLFFIGLIDFLRDLNIEAAVPVVIIIGTGIAFLIVTTMAPAFQYLIYLARRRLAAGWEYIHPPMFAFRSPQSRAVLRLVAWLCSAKDLDWTSCDIDFIHNSSAFDKYTARGLAWLDEMFVYSAEAVYQIFICMHDTSVPALKRLAHELLHLRKFNNVDKVLFEDFEEYARMVLFTDHVQEGVARDIVTGVYLNHRTNRRHNNTHITERRIRVLHATVLSVTPELLYDVFKNLKTSEEMTPELRWQEAMLLRTLLAQERLQVLSVTDRIHGYDIPWAVVGGVSDVCAYHEIFSDGDLELFFNTVHTWMERYAGRRARVMKRFSGRIDIDLEPAASRRDSVRRFVEFLESQSDG